MERVIVINWAVISVFILLLQVVASASDHDSRNAILRHHEGSEGGESKESHVWFSPTLGRKKRNSGSDDFYENIQKDGLAALIMDAIKDVPWTDVQMQTANDGKRHVANFTPRLGRDSGEDILNGLGTDESRWLQEPLLAEELLYQRSPPFAPRLGRHLSPFYPRLGRDHDKMSFS